MPLMEWDESYGVDQPEIDEQHKMWISILNDLHGVLMAGDAAEYQKARNDALQAMMNYVRLHFEEEEAYMRRIGYPGLDEHKQIHSRYYVQVMRLYNDSRSGELILSTEIMKSLKSWLERHILVEDKKYSRFASGEMGDPSGPDRGA